MSEALYVATDSNGVEHTVDGNVSWQLPAPGRDAVTERDAGLVLRRPIALVDTLGERIWRAEPVQPAVAPATADGLSHVRSARLVADTGFGPELAARFALDCAEHCEVDLDGIQLKGHVKLLDVLAEARRVVEGLEPRSAQPLTHLTRIWEYHRLRRERAELADLQGLVIRDDEAQGREAEEDPDYADLLPITDAVLAALGALREVLAARLLAFAEHREETEAHAQEEGRPFEPGGTVETPWGLLHGGPRIEEYEPAWTAARDAARRARLSARDRGGRAAERAELAWQADRLAGLLAGRDDATGARAPAGAGT